MAKKEGKIKEAKKKRANKYEEKLAIDGTFDDVFKVMKKHKEEKKYNYNKNDQK